MFNLIKDLFKIQGMRSLFNDNSQNELIQKRNKAIVKEEQRVECELAGHIPPPIPNSIVRDSCIIWRLRENVYMQNKIDDNIYSIVIVDCKKFYLLWLKSYDNSFLCPLKENMCKDRKYHYAVVGFSQGIENPVPLASISCWEDGSIHFCDGITRTLWLIYNMIPSFPIALSCKDEAKRLHVLAGIGNFDD